VDSNPGHCRRSLGLNDSNGLVELEGQHGLRRHSDRAALRQDLSQRAASSAGPGSNRGTFPASRNGTDNSAESSCAACVLGGSFVCAKPLLATFPHIAAANQALDRAIQFNPDLLLVSAGFDAFMLDPLTDMNLEVEDFAGFGRRLRETGVPVAAILEGGYSQHLPMLVETFLAAWSG